ncbi:MAG: cytochrome c biogenesis protein ResB [Propionibacteriaceae bacterium]|nr:cytochrome c biogenesis protein ResB [Propionibacteriaceae bacterium]
MTDNKPKKRVSTKDEKSSKKKPTQEDLTLDKETAELAESEEIVQELVTVEEEEDVPQVSLGEFFHRIYQVTYSKTIGLVIILILTIYCLLGILLAQAPRSARTDPMVKAQFLAAMQEKYGGFATILNALGLFHVFTSIGFLVVLGALVISILGCTTHRLPGLWQRFRHPKVTVSPQFFTKTRYRGSVQTPSKEKSPLDLAEQKMTEAHYRVIRHGDDGLFADKNSWGPLGTVIAHLSFIIIIGALMLSSLGAYENLLMVPAGADYQVPLDMLEDTTIEAVSFDAPVIELQVEDNEGQVHNIPRPIDYVSHLVIRQGGVVVAEKDDLRVNSPLHYGGYNFYQTTYGRTVDVTITLDGETLASRPVEQSLGTFLWPHKDDELAELAGPVTGGQVDFPEMNMIIGVYLPVASDQPHPLVEAGQAVFEILTVGEQGRLSVNRWAVVDQGEVYTPEMLVLEIDDKPHQAQMTMTFNREGVYTGITVRKDPGAIWMLIGSILLIIGMLMTFMFRHKRIWMRAEDGKLLFASPDKKDSGFTREFDELLTQAETWFDKPRRKP